MLHKNSKNQTPKLFKAIRRADKIIAVSQFTKQELINKLNVPENKIHIIYHGVDTKLFKPSQSK